MINICNFLNEKQRQIILLLNSILQRLYNILKIPIHRMWDLQQLYYPGEQPTVDEADSRVPHNNIQEVHIN